MKYKEEVDREWDALAVLLKLQGVTPKEMRRMCDPNSKSILCDLYKKEGIQYNYKAQVQRDSALLSRIFPNGEL